MSHVGPPKEKKQTELKTEQTIEKSNSLKMMHINIQSINNKYDELSALFLNKKKAEKLLSDFSQLYENLVLFGDFNINFGVANNTELQELLTLFSSFGLRPDNFITNYQSFNVEVEDPGLSDHQAQIFSLLQVEMDRSPDVFVNRIICQRGLLGLRSRLENVDWLQINYLDPDNAAEQITQSYSDLVQNISLKNVNPNSNHSRGFPMNLMKCGETFQL
ncbi:hypothetical protein HHI36_014976 [Cryptolaemus montrouzieri]|uniref:Uncharacterized protein n=1 Tax=Cryptolaemus montrouzieri TaxID=559131 RepID=A0ABD2N483_9CUCU